jgi:hypothetical protein
MHTLTLMVLVIETVSPLPSVLLSGMFGLLRIFWPSLMS